MGWAATEFETIDLGDERRNKRAIRLVDRLSAQPTASVPQACGDWADTIAAYRFFNNEAGLDSYATVLPLSAVEIEASAQ